MVVPQPRGGVGDGNIRLVVVCFLEPVAPAKISSCVR